MRRGQGGLYDFDFDFASFRFQFAGEITFDMLAPGPSMRCQLKHRRRRYQYQLQRHWDGSAAPADLREGVTNAYMVVREVRCLESVCVLGVVMW